MNDAKQNAFNPSDLTSDFSSNHEASTAHEPTKTGNADDSIKEMVESLPVIPNFTVISVLGRGGMGIVYKALQQPLNRIVALKMILRGEHAGKEDRMRFLAEAENIAKIQHPGVVQVYEYGTHNGIPYFALEYVPGGTLQQKLAGEILHQRDAAILVMRLAQAIKAAHDLGIVHRDLKPANVLLATTSEPKITDFGLAKTVSSNLTATGVILGTPSYMAPEQADGKKQIGPSVDIYALGAILYECLTGRPPFKAAVQLETILQVVNETPVGVRVLNKSVSRELEAICLKCLAKSPEGRYASAQQLQDDLERFLTTGENSTDIQGIKLALPIHSRRKSPTSRLTYLFVALLASAIVLAILVQQWIAMDTGDTPKSSSSAPSVDEPSALSDVARLAKKDTDEAQKRIADLRYLGTLDARYYPEAESQLIQALRKDRVETVRCVAAEECARIKNPSKKIIECLMISIIGSERDAFPAEKSEKVIAYAKASLAACIKNYNYDFVSESTRARCFALAGETELAKVHLQNAIRNSMTSEQGKQYVARTILMFLPPSEGYWSHLADLSMFPVVEGLFMQSSDLITLALINAKMGNMAAAMNEYKLIRFSHSKYWCPSYEVNEMEQLLGLSISKLSDNPEKPRE